MTTVLANLSFRPLDGTDSFDVVREEAPRDMQARSVERGTVKPTSSPKLTKTTERARTIAHLSEPIHKDVLNDTEAVASFLENVMRMGVLEALEDMVIAGDSTIGGGLDDFDGILNASGTHAQTFATDILTTLRKSLTALQQSRLAGPFLYVLSAETWEALELLTSATPYVLSDPGTSGRSIPIDRARQQIWGQPVAISEVLDGTDQALLGDFSERSVVVREREATVIEWSEAIQVALNESGGATASGFELNERVFRAEARYGLELKRPWAFVVADLSA